MELAYRGSTTEVQNKLRRVFNVWRERGVFEPVILGEIDRRLDGIPQERGTEMLIIGVDKAKGKGGIIRPGKSAAQAIPPELVGPQCLYPI